ncbi:hypothetical protein CC78DRAFT_240261 [Lojkania enalia]|uniref:Uncharacterized protein n=1 Tax=Lojkania enalia TaxID=147567 RepID=A0A9P4NAZ4_9PLEO|nr:hypothetical protein CC78DRAFT_240261 [Didymosphaeria enalia]
MAMAIGATSFRAAIIFTRACIMDLAWLSKLHICSGSGPRRSRRSEGGRLYLPPKIGDYIYLEHWKASVVTRNGALGGRARERRTVYGCAEGDAQDVGFAIARALQCPWRLGRVMCEDYGGNYNLCSAGGPPCGYQVEGETHEFLASRSKQRGGISHGTGCKAKYQLQARSGLHSVRSARSVSS